MINIYKKIIELNEQGINSVLCTIVSTKGSTPLKEGAKMIVCKDKNFGTVGGGTLEKKTIDKAKQMLRVSGYSIENIDLVSEEGTSCGGKVSVFFEPIMQNFKLYIFGAGHVGKALVNLVKDINFDITVIDDRNDIFDSWKNDEIEKRICNMVKYLDEIDFNNKTFIIIVTYDHNIDRDILSYCASKPWHYLGMMGSRNKAKSMKNKLLKHGISTDILDRIDMPIGLDINAENAKEIGISIAGKLIMEKYALIEEMKK